MPGPASREETRISANFFPLRPRKICPLAEKPPMPPPSCPFKKRNICLFPS